MPVILELVRGNQKLMRSSFEGMRYFCEGKVERSELSRGSKKWADAR
jgi:hypothetical protein